MFDWVLNSVLARNISIFLITTGIVKFKCKILNVQFRMLSQQFGANFIFTKSCFAFFSKVYHSRIWDTLPTSKMEFFVTIGIYKVLFCRLMILYTQYSCISVFIFVSSLPAPFRSRWFHLQASEMVFFVTITFANVVFYWVMVLHVQFLSINFFFFLCQSVAESISLQVVPGNSSLFKVVSARSRQFQLVPGGSSSFFLLVYTKIVTIER